YNTQLERLMERDGIDLDYAKAKVETQKDLITIEAESDIIFNNSTTVEDLRNQLLEVLEDKNLL
ncbi:hypothetical protein, partial [Escherichia coli]|uniref:hypothetical protein n=1 Tax=Escherichia coli TaxID=562 RepID=UPI001BC8478F